ncbi:MAG: hypothetical protein AMXMBFR84_20210 [Candidatus Hydrogenedentota bacterium]
MATIRVRGVQMRVSAKIEQNLPRILEKLFPCDADFVAFPEMCLTGYHGEFSDKATRAGWEKIAAACRQAYTCALVGTGFKDNGSIYIQTRVFGADGTTAGTYEKIVPTETERKFCSPGSELRTFKHAGVSFGCLICNDLWVTPGCGPYPDPRLSYQLGKKGVQVIFHAVHSGTDPRYLEYHESNVRLRAKESRAYIVTVNAADERGAINCPSGIVSPEGEWLVTVPREGEHTFDYDIQVEIED